MGRISTAARIRRCTCTTDNIQFPPTRPTSRGRVHACNRLRGASAGSSQPSSSCRDHTRTKKRQEGWAKYKEGQVKEELLLEKPSARIGDSKGVASWNYLSRRVTGSFCFLDTVL